MSLYHIAKGPVNYTVVGNPTIVDGVVSDFSANNYIELASYPDFQNANSWEFFLKIKRTDEGLFAGFTTGGNGFDLGITNGGKLWFEVGANYSWIFALNGTTVLSTDVWYYARFVFTGTEYKAFLSTDKVNWTEEISYTSSTKASNTYYKTIGSDRRFNNYFRGSIDLNNTYITIDGVPVFGKAPVEVKKVVRQSSGSTAEVNYVIKDGKLVFADPRIYLESNGTSYIDTGVTGANDTYEIKYSNFSFRDRCSIFGSLHRYNYSLSMYGTDLRYCFPTKMYKTTNQLSYPISDICICSADGVSSQNNTFSWAADTNSGDGNMTLFNGVDNNPTTGRIHFFKWTKTSGLFMYLVPVPTGLVIGNFTVPSNGMFDMVNQQFYANQGTGEFTIGRDE